MLWKQVVGKVLWRTVCTPIQYVEHALFVVSAKVGNFVVEELLYADGVCPWCGASGREVDGTFCWPCFAKSEEEDAKQGRYC